MIWRVRDRSTFEALRREGCRARRGAVSVTYLPTPGRPRVAFGVGRRVGPAVVRNRIRRRLRSAAREFAAGDRGLPAGAYLVTVSPRAADLGFPELRRQFGEACNAATSSAHWPPGEQP